MADIQLRFNLDMLALSTSFDRVLDEQGFTDDADQIYALLCEPELFEEAFRTEAMIETPCFVAPSNLITPAHIAYSNFTDCMDDMARNAYETAAAFKPQHLLAEIASTALPLDPESKTSLKQSKDQYQRAVKALRAYPFDAMYFTHITNAYDAQCALMGARSIYDGPVMLSYCLDENGKLSSPHTLKDAIALGDEYGADALGITTALPLGRVLELVEEMKEATDKPLIVELVVKSVEQRQFEATDDNPYYIASTMYDAALQLQRAGVQFLRAVGNATPSYTGTLNAVLAGSPVVVK